MNKPTQSNINNFKNYNNRYNKLKRKTKSDYFTNKLELYKHDMKRMWTVLKEAIGKQNDKTSIPLTFIIDNKLVSNKHEIVNSFNNYFSKIGLSTSENVPRSQNRISDFLKRPCPHSMYLEQIEPDQIIEVVNKLKPKLSSGHDDIPTKLLKLSIDSILLPITHIVNRSFSTGIFPNQLKVAKVLPIHKSSNPNELTNYRPISLLPAFSKLLEKIMFNKVMSFLDAKQILYKHQYGFRAKHSTIHPIIHLLNECADANNSNPKKYTISIFCDLSKAFDVISHNILLKKLNFYGIRGIVNTWFANYLSNRCQYVEMYGEKSDTKNISCGLPQGSILGPLLYLLYVNDIPNSTSGHILSFADDTSLFISDSNITNLYLRANHAMAGLYDWFCVNRLSLNPNKTKYIVFNPHKRHSNQEHLDIHIDNVPLKQIGTHSAEKTTKFLGLYMDENLSWKFHLNQVNSKISRALFSIKQAKHFRPIESMRTLYNALIQPHLSYGIIAWGNATATTIKKTNILHKRAIRVINKSEYNSHTDPLFKSSKILKLNDLYESQVVVFMQHFLHHKLPKSFDNSFKLNCDVQLSHQTRQSDLFYIERCDSLFVKRMPLFNFPIIWNKWIRSLSGHATNRHIQNQMKKSILSGYADKVKCKNPLCRQCQALRL